MNTIEYDVVTNDVDLKKSINHFCNIKNQSPKILIKLSQQILIGRCIDILRNQKNISLETLAYDANIEKKHLWLIVKGKLNPTLNTISKICESLDLSLSEFFKIVESME